MIMKGGVLLALSYRSPRYTKDIDFSTAIKRPDFDLADFRRHLENSLSDAVETLGLRSRLPCPELHQKPQNDDATFPTFKISIGYAARGHSRPQTAASRGGSTCRLDRLQLERAGRRDRAVRAGGRQRHPNLQSGGDGGGEVPRPAPAGGRNRSRRQDIFDLHYVLSDHPLREDALTKQRILDRLLEKSRIRELPIDPWAMSNPEIRRRSEARYHELASEIEGDLPPFDEVYDVVEAFYRSLPWPQD